MLHSHSNPKLYGTGTKTDIDKCDKIEPKYTHVPMINQSMIKEARIYSGGKERFFNK